MKIPLRAMMLNLGSTQESHGEFSKLCLVPSPTDSDLIGLNVIPGYQIFRRKEFAAKVENH